MDKLQIVRDHLEKEKKILNKSLQQAKHTRNSAPSAMQSHHDTTRNQTERLITALEEKTTLLEKQMSLIPKIDPTSGDKVEQWSYIQFTLDSNKTVIKAIIVPKDMGGVEVGNTILLSINSPLGKCLLNKKIEDNINFNETKGIILKIN